MKNNLKQSSDQGKSQRVESAGSTSAAPPQFKLDASVNTPGQEPAQLSAASTVAGAGAGAVAGAALGAAAGSFFPVVGTGIGGLMGGLAGGLMGGIAGSLMDNNDPIAADGQILRDHQATRAQTNYEALSDDDRTTFDQVISQAGSDSERQYIYKALSAGHSVAEISTFAGSIRGKDDEWLTDNLSLTNDSNGQGVRQQWSFSCNATIVQAVRGEMDPIYALQTHTDNPDLHDVNDADATDMNPDLAEEQRVMLESQYAGARFGPHTGVASDVDDPASGSGRWADDLLNANSGSTGITYNPEVIGTDVSLADAITAIDSDLDSGMPVPVVVGSGVGVTAHYVLITQSTDSPAGRVYTIHNPGDGQTTQVPLADIQNSNMNLSGWTTLTAIENATSNNP